VHIIGIPFNTLYKSRSSPPHFRQENARKSARQLSANISRNRDVLLLKHDVWLDTTKSVRFRAAPELYLSVLGLYMLNDGVSSAPRFRAIASVIMSQTLQKCMEE
jgi:hypothetical protein